MPYGNVRSGSVHQNKGRGGVGQGAKPVTSQAGGRNNRTHIPQGQRAPAIGRTRGTPEQQSGKSLIAELSYSDLFGHGEKQRHVPDQETVKDLFVTLGLFAPEHDPKVLVKALKLTGAEEGHPLKSITGAEMVIERKFLTNHTLPLDKKQSSEMKAMIQYLRAYIVRIAGHVPNGQRR